MSSHRMTHGALLSVLCLSLVSCFEALNDPPECFNLESLEIPAGSDEGEAYRILANAGSHCIQTTGRGENLDKICEQFYIDKLGLSKTDPFKRLSKFPGLVFAVSQSLNEDTSGCIIDCGAGCECLFARDCDRSESCVSSGNLRGEERDDFCGGMERCTRCMPREQVEE
ncbi:MAG: hypothetical protein VYD19_03880 [Myxococcota bacterium]|nr:hypothetical protein [Myxococcota bacterium]